MLLRRRTIDPRTDEELVARIRDGHRASLGFLWDRYAHLLLGTAMKYLKDHEQARDAVVDVFERLPRTLSEHDVKLFRPWIHAVMRNHCLQLLRKAKPDVHDERTLANITEEEGDDRSLREASLEQLEEAIDRLNEQQRTCVRLFYLERKCYQQVQELTGHSYDQVRSHLQNGRRNLKLMLSGIAH